MTKTPMPILIESNNLSKGWAEVLLRISAPGGGVISPLILSITGFSVDGIPAEDPKIRSAIDAMLASEGLKDVENVAFTIFPQRYLTMVGGDRHDLYNLYKDAFLRIQKFNPQHNSRGSYFQRLIDFNGDGSGPNQLEWMLEEYEKHPNNRRRSKFQAAIFDPRRDPISTPYMEFPCLQGISFTFDDDQTLVVNAFYATQQLVHKGYGNYLGLSQLGAFIAKEMGRRLVQLNVFVGVAKADKISGANKNLKELLVALKEAVEADVREFA